MKNKYILKIFVAAFLINTYAYAQEATKTSSAAPNSGQISAPVSETLAPKTKAFKASFNTYYFDFQGTQSAQNGLYNFGSYVLKKQSFGFQYTTDSKWTLAVTGQYLENKLTTRLLGFSSYDETSGLGDTSISATHSVISQGRYSLLAEVGMYVPTGSINEKSRLKPSANYSYNFQLGSGTFDGSIGILNLWNDKLFQAGSKISVIERNGQSANGYRLGNIYRADAWLNYPLKYGFTPKISAFYKHKDPVLGQDVTYSRSKWNEYYYHPFINWEVTAALKYDHTFGKDINLGGEIGIPLAQDMQNYDGFVIASNFYVNLFASSKF